MREYEERSAQEELIEGRNAVTEALRAGTAVDKLYVARGETDHTLGRIIAQAKRAGVVVVEADRRKLDAMSETRSHQGVIAVAAAQRYATVEDILQKAADRGEPPLVVVCDEISDPHNLGAVIRTAECAGAHGPLYEADLRSPAAIVIGSEGDGMGRLVRESCDFLVSIPMKGRISSLNASAAAAVLLYEALRQRLG